MEKNLVNETENKPGAVKRIAKEFEAFVTRGNVVDLAIGIVIGAAFGKIVSSFVNDVVMPLISALFGKVDLSGMFVQIGSAKIMYGNFIQNIIDFLFIAVGVFVFIKLINRINNNAIDFATGKTVVKDKQLKVLQEIRDELVKK
ncbi:large conductance mechanosensitive channel protein MscL [Candidatus Saccharibacteria bacterium]|nr:large conductance mechanosensitive channel protein MscL [Candidatus Saccharibacteria bacterium]MCL1962971.1 large conductance mechanosensitive channel protein MscL [Candidatus Saccharibacteria bacterium]